MKFIERTNRDDIEILITVYDNENSVVNLSGVNLIQFAISIDENSTENEILKSYPASGIELINPTNGQYLVTIPNGDVSDMLGEYYWESRVTINSESSTVAKGIIRIKNSVF